MIKIRLNINRKQNKKKERKSWFFENTNKIDKSLAGLERKYKLPILGIKDYY